MKILGRLLITALLLTAAPSVSAAPPKPPKPPDWGVQVGIFSGDFGFGARKDIFLGGEISRISAQGAVYFQHRTTFRIDADYHFVIKAGEGRFYPLAGIDFGFNTDGVALGINGGGGANFMLTQALAAFVEAKYVFSKWDGWVLVGGVYF